MSRVIPLFLLFLDVAASFAQTEVKLTAPGASIRLGNSIAVSADSAVIGDVLDGDLGSGAGAAYVFGRDQGGPDSWGQVKKLLASDGSAGDSFGRVAIDGDTIVVGAISGDGLTSDSGSAYVFVRNHGGAENWGQVAKLMASDGDSGDLFGTVAMSGDLVVVGASADGDAGLLSGSAYLFHRNHGGIDSWGQVAKLTASDAAAGDEFGIFVAVDGDTVLVGARREELATNAGSAYIFYRDRGGPDSWGQVARITAVDAAADDSFGVAGSIQGDTAVVGSIMDDDRGVDSGSAYVFERHQGGMDSWGQVAKITPSDGEAGDLFANGVAIRGDSAVIGSRQDDDVGLDSGSAYLFHRHQGGPDNWGQIAKYTASDAAAGDEFGIGAALDAETALIGTRLGSAAYVLYGPPLPVELQSFVVE